VNGYQPTYDNLPSDEEVAIYEAQFCWPCETRGVRREIAHDEVTGAFTDERVCRPCALYAWGYDLLFGSVPDECRGPCPTLTYREARQHLVAGPILMARQPVVVFEVFTSPAAFEFVDGCSHQYDWNLKGCRCRYCKCCSQYWAAGSNDIKAGDEEGTPREDCPECVAWKAAGCPPDPVVSEMEKVGAP
jgi:hypothetical protein